MLKYNICIWNLAETKVDRATMGIQEGQPPWIPGVAQSLRYAAKFCFTLEVI